MLTRAQTNRFYEIPAMARPGFVAKLKVGLPNTPSNKTTDPKYDNYRKKYIKYRKKFYALLKEKLAESVYPTQGRDFFFLTIPDKHPDAGRLVPVDYQLRNLILYFWNNGLITMGWDQGYDTFHPQYFGNGFITFDILKTDSSKSFPYLKKLLIDKFGQKMISIKIYDSDTWNTAEEATIGIKKQLQDQRDFFINNPSMILLEVFPNYIGMLFRNDMIPIIYQKLGLETEDYDERLPGNLIEYDPGDVSL